MHDNSYLLPRDAKARTFLKPFRLKHNRMCPPTLWPLRWGRYRASVNVLKLDTIVNNTATREGEETVESSRPKRNQWPPALQENNSLPLRWRLASASLGKRACARLFGCKRESRGKQEIQNSEQPLPWRNKCLTLRWGALTRLGKRAKARHYC